MVLISNYQLGSLLHSTTIFNMHWKSKGGNEDKCVIFLQMRHQREALLHGE